MSGYDYLNNNNLAQTFNNPYVGHCSMAQNYNLNQYSLSPYMYGTPQYCYNNYSDNTSSATTTSSQSSSRKNQDEIIREYKKTLKEKLRLANLSTVFKGDLTKKEEEKLLKQHSISYEPYQNLLSTIGMGVGFGGLMLNTNILKHPINTITTTFSKKGVTNTMFNKFVKTPAGKDFWKANNNLMEEAFYQMHRAEVRSKKWGFMGVFKKKLSSKDFSAMKNLMERAIATNDAQKIAEATERIRHASINDGWIPSAKRWTQKQLSKILPFVKDPGKSPEIWRKVWSNSSETRKIIAEESAKLLKNNKFTFGKACKKAIGGKLGVFISLASILGEIPLCKEAYKESKELGKKQTKQTLVKFGARTAGWMAGEAVGIWAGAKLGAAIGSVVPGLGTAIGAVAGAIGGSIVSHFADKWARKAVGDNVMNSVKSKKLAQTEEGKIEIISELKRQADKGEIKDKETLALVERAYAGYAEEIARIQALQSQAQGQQLTTQTA